ncbi:MAG: short-chain dehydrogenase/reductase [Nocardioidaceae bacterium]|nr:short-chain dehydrogenase/reductase [Nocardioidaceae bacterium]
MVFGASRGIGKGIALAIAAAGTHVVVVARAQGDGRYPGSASDTVDEIRAAGGSASALACDISDPVNVRDAVDTTGREHGTLDVVINSTVHISYGELANITADEWDSTYAVNVRGPFVLTKAACEVMRRQRSGHIIHLTGAAARHAHLGNVLTGSSKAALERFVAGAAAETRPYGVSVSLFDPGRVRTERAEILQAGTDWTGIAVPGDVAAAVVHIISLPSTSTNGQRFSYDGSAARGYVSAPLLTDAD